MMGSDGEAAASAKPVISVASVWKVREIRRKQAKDLDKETLKRQARELLRQSPYILRSEQRRTEVAVCSVIDYSRWDHLDVSDSDVARADAAEEGGDEDEENWEENGEEETEVSDYLLEEEYCYDYLGEDGGMTFVGKQEDEEEEAWYAEEEMAEVGLVSGPQLEQETNEEEAWSAEVEDETEVGLISDPQQKEEIAEGRSR